jgi:NTP pyrophosphatase (non-canonical NTP hydrolase)
VLTVLLTSSRVAPGLLSWEAWAALREAARVIAGADDHPQVPALASAGITVTPASFADAAEVAGEGKRIVWLAPPGTDFEPGSGFEPGSDVEPGEVPARVVRGSVDLPGAHLIDAVSVMDTLRVSCPWDRQQTHASLLRYLLEEAYEAAEAIELSDFPAMREELGDVLFQTVFHARVASERPAAEGGFTIDDVADVLVSKLKRRHPHVFGSVSVSGADEVNRNWEEIKKAEKASRASAAGSGPASVLDGVPFGQPALSLAAQLQRRAERAGARVPGDSGGDAGHVEGADGATAAEVGAELMRVVARARSAGVDPELALREAARAFADQVRKAERSNPPK